MAQLSRLRPRVFRCTWLINIGFVVFLALLLAGPAFAHARYERSKPGAGAVVSSAPERVEIWFSQELFRRSGENWIHVEDSNGARVEVGEAEIDDDDRTRLFVELQADLGPGTFLVRWGNLSAEDGDSDEGQFSFIYDPQAVVTSTPMAVTSPTTPATAPPAAGETPVAATTLASDLNRTPDAAALDSESAGGCGLGQVPVFAVVSLAILGRLWNRQKR